MRLLSCSGLATVTCTPTAALARVNGVTPGVFSVRPRQGILTVYRHNCSGTIASQLHCFAHLSFGNDSSLGHLPMYLLSAENVQTYNYLMDTAKFYQVPVGGVSLHRVNMPLHHCWRLLLVFGCVIRVLGVHYAQLQLVAL